MTSWLKYLTYDLWTVTFLGFNSHRNSISWPEKITSRFVCLLQMSRIFREDKYLAVPQIELLIQLWDWFHDVYKYFKTTVSVKWDQICPNVSTPGGVVTVSVVFFVVSFLWFVKFAFEKTFSNMFLFFRSDCFLIMVYFANLLNFLKCLLSCICTVD